jgi:hypothetical protein
LWKSYIPQNAAGFQYSLQGVKIPNNQPIMPGNKREHLPSYSGNEDSSGSVVSSNSSNGGVNQSLLIGTIKPNSIFVSEQ